LLPQLHFYNVHGQLLGTDAWGSKEVLGLDPDIVNGAVFASALLAGSDNPAYQRFRLAYKDLFDAEPTHLSALGYDACNLVMGSAQKLTRSAVAETLSSLTGYRGASGRVDLTQDRSNSELPIFEIQSGQTREKNPTLVSDEQSGK
jgi:ABC-type branched-subunit amino acid transport system substrate-binding protein